jgi:hypothetical protein
MLHQKEQPDFKTLLIEHLRLGEDDQCTFDDYESAMREAIVARLADDLFTSRKSQDWKSKEVMCLLNIYRSIWMLQIAS